MAQEKQLCYQKYNAFPADCEAPLERANISSRLIFVRTAQGVLRTSWSVQFGTVYVFGLIVTKKISTTVMNGSYFGWLSDLSPMQGEVGGLNGISGTYLPTVSFRLFSILHYLLELCSNLLIKCHRFSVVFNMGKGEWEKGYMKPSGSWYMTKNFHYWRNMAS